MKPKKVLIIGAGPSGLACAEEILTNNWTYDVTIMDKKSKVGENSRCAGGISLWMAEKVGVEVPESCIVATIRNLCIYAPNGNCWQLKSDKPYGYIINRELFEQGMAKRVEELGGKIELGHSVRSLAHVWKFLQEYDYVVGADGFPSAVSKWIGASQPVPSDIHHCFQREIVWDWFPKDTIEVYFGSVAPKGYLWLFTAGEGKVRAGLGTPLSERANLRELLDGFLERQTYNYELVSTVSKLIPTAKPRDTNVFDRVALVGDAGLFCDAMTGGGIMQGIASGKAAGKALAEGKPRNYDRYIGWLRKQNSRRYRLKKVLYSFSDEDLNELIQVMKGFTPKSMSVGKELRRAILHLIWCKPRLFKKFFKYLR